MIKKIKIKKGDSVVVVAGDDKGKKGKVLKVLPSRDRAVVDGLNTMKKHRRGRKSGEKGQVVSISMPMHISNLKLDK